MSEPPISSLKVTTSTGEDITDSVKSASSLSGHYISKAREELGKCLEKEQEEATEQIYYTANAIDAVIYSHIALEVFLNEIIMYQKKIFRKQVGDIFRSFNIQQKCVFIPLYFWGKEFEKTNVLYQNVLTLVRLRNALIHYDMEYYKFGEGPRVIKALNNQNLLLTTGKEHFEYDWVHRISTNKVAYWAYDTACRAARKIIELSDDVLSWLKETTHENFERLNHK